MSYFVSPEFLRVLLLGFITSLHMTWRRLVNQIVPVPYLDEVFHVPQAQAYWLGKWSHWDAKITTPPGLYVYSYIVNSIRDFFTLNFRPSINQWRATNVLLLYMLLVALYILAAVSKRPVNHEGILQREFNIVMFPLIFFFSGLYYTDLFSVFSVVLAHIFWSAGTSAQGYTKVLHQTLHLGAGLISLASRQTNIFWVAVYLGGLQVIETIKHQVGPNKVHDPPILEAYFEEFPIFGISIVQSAITMIPQLLIDLWPQISLIISFAAFVLWNGGVVLGDKDNHIATIHLPQMLYIWPFVVFFSWPVLLPQLAQLSSFRRRLPRLTTALCFMILMLAVVKFNTVIHPFTLADNRHYTFYVFRILRQHWLIKYAAVPIYFVCAALVIGALGGGPAEARSESEAAQNRVLFGEDTIHASFMLVWLIATALSLVSAPLVEPRYFILPWLMWRLAVPEYVPKSRSVEQKRLVAAEKKDSPQDGRNAPSTWSIEQLLSATAAYSNVLELMWYITINLGTCYMFLYKGFDWPQEPGNIQRFMW
ncbi:glucosyltransferase [Elasticomyces elasticus]|uniref:Dol-P-Glc:Glc(2)Man(9)GlcNAc(2)-PP-Dol alpha-1,2-glucosyltransferase n=1 Tax=Exophiala sideris TaxID=1016849 RepID=A0ABR0JB62_9EURO|nr:glucosyltransferase [Elasticomyces elasticus]KAK5027805.1 glucosyltransferase [Exophiala sideris]KAK5037607.1 glucosyltransferase [Exophiala sideris]KAK5059269.1 glucosyltransferase [Exophiala sideris]KAK5183103.1 glucosyltransferase [Eurotiomycetes sp. CCFEE 6388]